MLAPFVMSIDIRLGNRRARLIPRGETIRSEQARAAQAPALVRLPGRRGVPRQAGDPSRARRVPADRGEGTPAPAPDRASRSPWTPPARAVRARDSTWRAGRRAG